MWDDRLTRWAGAPELVTAVADGHALEFAKRGRGREASLGTVRKATRCLGGGKVGCPQPGEGRERARPAVAGGGSAFAPLGFSRGPAALHDAARNSGSGLGVTNRNCAAEAADALSDGVSPT